MTDESIFNQWKKERNVAISSLDPATFREFYKKWQANGFYDAPLPDDDRVVEALICKAAIHIPSIPTSRREEARDWLSHNGFTEDIG